MCHPAGLTAEIQLLRMLCHPNIVRFVGAILVSDAPSVRSLQRAGPLLVTELIEGGSLHSLLHGCGTRGSAARTSGCALEAAEAAMLGADVCRGMAYLHGFRPPVLHRDLKSTNLLVAEHGPQKCLKICDFGLAAVKATKRPLSDRVGTLAWMPPEILQNQPFTEAADVYSFGVVLWEMLSGKEPWVGLESAAALACQVVVQQERPPLPVGCALSAAVLPSCWAADPALRPSFRALLEQLEESMGPMDAECA
eukprot:SAG31_NODE_4517_length_3171_cov_4.097331_2_plen_252_part_00